MAKTSENDLTRFYRGKFGTNMVYRMVDGISILQRSPDFSRTRWSKAQKAWRKEFGKATVYAHRANADPELRAYYHKKRKPLCNAWNMAMSDYLNNPSIESVETPDFKGKKGDKVLVYADDNFAIASVLVFILTSQGIEIESGLAPYNYDDGSYDYILQGDIPNPRNCKILVKVRDVPGNQVREILDMRRQT
jgi:hypothetical protein